MNKAMDLITHHDTIDITKSQVVQMQDVKAFTTNLKKLEKEIQSTLPQKYVKFEQVQGGKARIINDAKCSKSELSTEQTI